MLQWYRSNPENESFGALFLLSYVFLLRLPSEALPVRIGKGGLHMEGDALVLELEKRKNKPQGSRLVRKCCCSTTKVVLFVLLPKSEFAREFVLGHLSCLHVGEDGGSCPRRVSPFCRHRARGGTQGDPAHAGGYWGERRRGLQMP